jgi:hypothetical protein
LRLITTQKTPGPALYSGKYDAPTGEAPVAKETGYYTGEIAQKYTALIAKLQAPGTKLTEFVNGAWPAYNPDKAAFKQYGGMVKDASKERNAILLEADELRKEIEKSGQNA